MSSCPQTTAAFRSMLLSTEGTNVHIQPRAVPSAMITAVFLGCCHLNSGWQLASSNSTRFTLLPRDLIIPASFRYSSFSTDVLLKRAIPIFLRSFTRPSSFLTPSATRPISNTPNCAPKALFSPSTDRSVGPMLRRIISWSGVWAFISFTFFSGSIPKILHFLASCQI